MAAALRPILLSLGLAAALEFGAWPAAKAQAGSHGSAIDVRVGRLVKAGQCQTALDLALTSGRLKLAGRVRDLCSGAAAPAPADATFADSAGADPPKSLEPADVQAWAAHNLDAKDWESVDFDGDGVNLVKAADAALTPSKTLRIYGREELFRPAERSGVMARSDRQEFEVDCTGKRFRLLSMQIFSGNNLSGHSRDIPGPLTDWQVAAPNTHRFEQVTRLCDVGQKALSLASTSDAIKRDKPAAPN